MLNTPASWMYADRRVALLSLSKIVKSALTAPLAVLGHFNNLEGLIDVDCSCLWMHLL